MTDAEEDRGLRGDWARDPVVFDRVYREIAPRLRAFLRQWVGSPQAAEDLTQEIFTRLWSRPHGYDPVRGSLRAYLFGVGRHRAAEWWRGRKPEELMADERCGECDQERDAVMADVLRQLPEEQRALLWLREVEGQSYAELAEILGVPVGTVRSRLFAARTALRGVWLGTKEPQVFEADKTGKKGALPYEVR